MPQSKKKSRQQLTLLLTGIFFFTLASSAAVFDHGHLKQGFGLFGVAALSVAAMLGFTIRTRCRVITGKGSPCRNEAYGFLFGCDKAAGHKSTKLFARLGWESESIKSNSRTQNVEGNLTLNVGGSRSARHAGASSAQQEVQRISVTVPNAGMGVCAFWFGLISTLAAVTGVIVSIMGLAR
jgi:hypothetical protein